MVNENDSLSSSTNSNKTLFTKVLDNHPFNGDINDFHQQCGIGLEIGAV